MSTTYALEENDFFSLVAGDELLIRRNGVRNTYGDEPDTYYSGTFETIVFVGPRRHLSIKIDHRVSLNPHYFWFWRKTPERMTELLLSGATVKHFFHRRPQLMSDPQPVMKMP